MYYSVIYEKQENFIIQKKIYLGLVLV